MAGWVRFRPEDPVCCLPKAVGQYWELKEEKEALRRGMPGGGAWSWDAVTHMEQTHNRPAFLEWQEPADSPCRAFAGCIAYGKSGGLFSSFLSLVSLRIRESTRNERGMSAARWVQSMGAGWIVSSVLCLQRVLSPSWEVSRECSVRNGCWPLVWCWNCTPSSYIARPPCDGYDSALNSLFVPFLLAFPLHASSLFHLLTKWTA